MAATDELGDAVDLVLDGGPCRVGVESTIVELTGETPTLLRPGAVTVAQLEEALGRSVRPPAGPSRAPGMLPSHYAPKAAVEIVTRELLLARAEELRGQSRRVVTLVPSSDLDADARTLYARLRERGRIGSGRDPRGAA